MTANAAPPASLARELVGAFGDPDRIADLLSENASWWITPTIPPEIMQSSSTGREVIRGNMARVFSLLYEATTVRTEIHDIGGDHRLAAVRFTMTARFPNGGPYRNEYAVFVRANGGRITEVWEYVDAAHAVNQMQAAGITPPAST